MAAGGPAQTAQPVSIDPSFRCSPFDVYSVRRIASGALRKSPEFLDSGLRFAQQRDQHLPFAERHSVAEVEEAVQLGVDAFELRFDRGARLAQSFGDLRVGRARRLRERLDQRALGIGEAAEEVGAVAAPAFGQQVRVGAGGQARGQHRQPDELNAMLIRRRNVEHAALVNQHLLGEDRPHAVVVAKQQRGGQHSVDAHGLAPAGHQQVTVPGRVGVVDQGLEHGGVVSVSAKLIGDVEQRPAVWKAHFLIGGDDGGVVMPEDWPDGVVGVADAGSYGVGVDDYGAVNGGAPPQQFVQGKGDGFRPLA